MSDVEDDSVSLRVSLGPNDSIIISVHSSKGSSLSGLVLDLGSDVMSTRGIQAPSQQRLPDATPPLLDSEKSADKNKQASSSPNANEVSGLANLFQGRLGKLLTPRYGRPSLAPLRGIVRHRPALLPVLKTSQDVVATQETRKLEDPNTTRVMLFGAACSGKTSLMRSVELFCTGELRNAPGWFDLWVRRESAAERMINILDFMEVESVPFGVAESEKYLKSLVYNRTELMDAKSQREGIKNFSSLTSGDFDANHALSSLRCYSPPMEGRRGKKRFSPDDSRVLRLERLSVVSIPTMNKGRLANMGVVFSITSIDSRVSTG